MKRFVSQDEDIPGIPIRAFPVSEAQIRCIFDISYSDAKELTKATKAGLPINKELREMFLDRIGRSLQRVLKEKGK
jgi:hypothetical protein